LELAAPRHRDASKRKCRRIVAQGDPLQRAEGIARRQWAPPAVISESIEIPPHLSLPPFDIRCQNYLATNEER
jgi:hypothetical protein